MTGRKRSQVEPFVSVRVVGRRKPRVTAGVRLGGVFVGVSLGRLLRGLGGESKAGHRGPARRSLWNDSKAGY